MRLLAIITFIKTTIFHKFFGFFNMNSKIVFKNVFHNKEICNRLTHFLKYGIFLTRKRFLKYRFDIFLAIMSTG